ncbi:unnamed protein product [Sphagnum jensenii]|uniref:Uncharacterized protein n=1 Tax=Sphagnum jensenii TaxID=128206 RepID=A0ABP1AAQ3_9BRYO
MELLAPSQVRKDKLESYLSPIFETSNPTPIKKDKKTIRKKADKGSLPSCHYPDIEQPPLTIAQRALETYQSHKHIWSSKPTSRLQSKFIDEMGRMLIDGSIGGRYIGDMMGSLPHGYGQHWVPIFPNGEHLLYEGEWEYGGKSGKGQYYYLNGQEYEGGVRLGEHHGQGVMQYNNGSIYDGNWYESRKNGMGTFYYNDGRIYAGNWNKDNRDGWGTHYWPNKHRKYEGEWNGDHPLCGKWSTMTTIDFETLQNPNAPYWPTTYGENDVDGYPQENVEVPLLGLRNPELCFYPRCCTIRTKRPQQMDFGKMLKLNDWKHKQSLTEDQMEALWHGFDELTQGYYRRSKLHAVMLRRLLLLATMDPDSDMGVKLLAILLESAMQTNGLTFNNFIYHILAFQYP